MVMAGRGGGGMEKHTFDLCNELVSLGHSVALIAHPDFVGRTLPAVKLMPVDLSLGRMDPRALFNVCRALRQLQPQIVHAQANKAASIVGSLRYLLPAKAKTIATIHNEKRSRSMFRSFDARIAVSQLSADLLKPWRTTVIYNGIEPAPSRVIDTSPWQELKPGSRVLAAGRLVPAKAFDNLLEAWKQIDAPLVIAGSGPLEASLREKVIALRLGAKVRLLGHRDDVPQLMQSAELLVISSRNEGNPYVMVEALHARLPMVSTAVGAIPEVLPLRALCPKGNVEALTNTVKAALSDMAAMRLEFEPVFQRAKEDMSLKGMARQTVGVYEAALAAGY
jgi:glycosyltransferase involved in cell wall biosynthesis